MTDLDRSRGSLKAIAAELGVSAKTVSNAFNRPDQLSPALRDRVMATATRLGYAGPDPLARAFRRGRTNMVGVVYANRLSYAFEDPAAVAFLSGLSEVLETDGTGLVLIPGLASDSRRAGGLAQAMIDGVVAYSLAADDPVLTAIQQRDLPLVLADQPRLAGHSWVGIDDQAAAAAVARHLIELGHRRIGIVSFGINRDARRELFTLAELPAATLEVSARRLAGYAGALREVVDLADVPGVHLPDSARSEGRIGTDRLLSAHPSLTALICLSDQLAAGARDALTARTATGELLISIAGFDGINANDLTTVRQPHRDKGATAGRMLLATMRGEQEPTGVILPFEFVAASSTRSAVSRRSD